MIGVPVVAIDGPSGSGKGTTARLLAATLGWHLLDSGALYRLVAMAALRRGVSVDELQDSPGQSGLPDNCRQLLAEIAGTLDARFAVVDGQEAIFLDGENVTREIRTEIAGEAASRVAAIPEVRAALLRRQRAFATAPGLIADGRDMGSVVFPDAPVKVFLTASAEERARRRHKQLKEKGIDVSLRDLSWEIAQRDRRDESRAIAPLKPAADARIVDSTSMTPDQVVARVLSWLAEAGIQRESV